MRWLGRGFWAVADQGLFAASNFVLSVLLARWLAPQDYGAFAVAYAVFWFLGTFHTALLSEPMLIFGPGKYKDLLPEYLGVLLYMHLGFASLVSLPLLTASLAFGLFGSKALSLAMLGLGLSGPFILFQWLMRRACYTHLKPHLAASGGALYMVLMLIGAYVLYQHGWLSAAMAFGLMGFASLAAGLWLVTRLGVRRPQTTNSGLVREVFRSHRGYGWWAVPSSMLAWVPANVSYLLLPVWGGLEAGAAMRALMNLITPIIQGTIALSVFLLPILVQAREDESFGRFVRFALAVFVSGSVVYWVLLGLFHRPLVGWLYAGEYGEYADLLWFLGLLPLLIGVESVFGTALRALEQPNRMFWAYVLSAIVALTVGLWLLFYWGLAGAVGGVLISSAAAAERWRGFSSPQGEWRGR